MPAALATLAFLAAAATSAQVTRNAPSYSAATILNAASGDANALAPYTIIKINGTNLAWDAKVLQPADVRNSMVPVVLPNTGVHAYLNNQPLGILSVSPTQIIALVPGDLVAGPATFWVLLDGLIGPVVTLNLSQFAPGLFAKDDGILIAARENGDLVTPDTLLHPGEKVVLRAVGLGPADPPLLGLEIPAIALSLDVQTTVSIYVNDNPIDPALITKVGFLPSQPGVYQLTVQLPPDTPQNPELRIEANGFKSPVGFKLPVAVPPLPAPIVYRE